MDCIEPALPGSSPEARLQLDTPTGVRLPTVLPSTTAPPPGQGQTVAINGRAVGQPST